MTSEQVREKRRLERTQFKLDRAKAMAAVAAAAEQTFAAEGRVVTMEENRASIPSAATWKPTSAAPVVVPPIVPEEEGTLAELEEGGDEEPILDLEHLQLTLQEAFFLAWTLDCLTILDPTTVGTALANCLRLADTFIEPSHVITPDLAHISVRPSSRRTGPATRSPV
jgi:tRNA-splicing endonuclease subunit Sen2